MQLRDLWKSLIQASRSPVRRRRRESALAPWIAAEVLEHRTLLASPAHDVTLTVVNGDITLKSTDAASHTLTISRSVGNVIFAGGVDGTVITFGGTDLATQIVAIPTVGKITITTNTGADTYKIQDLSTTGTIAFQGSTTGGPARLDVLSKNADVTIGGAIQTDFGNEEARLVVESIATKTLTVNGAVTFKGVVTGAKEVDMGSLLGTVHLKSGVTFTDSGTFALDTFDIFGKIVIDGNVAYSNAKSTSGDDNIKIHDLADGVVPVLNGGLKLSFGKAHNKFSLNSSFDDAPLVINGPVTISSHSGFATAAVERVVFKNKFTISSPVSTAFTGGILNVDGAEFDGAVKITMGGVQVQVNIGTETAFTTPTLFKSAVTLKLPGPHAVVFLSNSNAGPQVTFDSTLSITGGNPQGELFEQGEVSIGAGKLKLKKFGGP